MTLFVEDAFVASSGRVLPWKVECDALTDDDWQWAAKRIAQRQWIGPLFGIPRGGMKLTQALKQYSDPQCDIPMIVDDVLTTGASMEKMRLACERVFESEPVGIVMFARVRPAAWINPIWQLWGL